MVCDVAFFLFTSRGDLTGCKTKMILILVLPICKFDFFEHSKTVSELLCGLVVKSHFGQNGFYLLSAF